jgi:transposase-like protein
VFDKIEEPPGDAAVAEARQRMDGFRAQWGKAYPGAVACLAEDFESLTVRLRFPTKHWKRCRHTNLIERTFGDSADARIMWTPNRAVLFRASIGQLQSA